MMWLSIVLGVVTVLALFLLVMHLLGRRLPEEHTASAAITLHQPQQPVWDTIADIAGHKHWVKGITKLERLPDRDGCPVWRQQMGRNSFTLVFSEIQPPTRMVGTIADDNKFFSGHWEYLVVPDGAGTRVTLTERGRVTYAIPRAMMEYLFGKDTYLKRHLRDLARKFGEKAPF